MLKSALPPAFLLLSACTVPAPPASESPHATAALDTPSVPAESPEVASDAATSAAHADVDPTRALFLANCAQCHGEKGDGEGVTQLDRKARSFLDGGFSYGNTKDAILRSITHGIPGTPMPAFEKALTEAQRVELADFVIALGPERPVVDPKAREMVVRDRALVVRGKLPALVEGGPEVPRGLAIGTPDGLTFEYRVDDVALRAVRAGAFVDRVDWDDRGGQTLGMLGMVVWTADPDALLIRFRNGADTPAVCRLVATDVEPGGAARIEYVAQLVGDSSQSVNVVERVSSFTCALGSGFVRRLSFRGANEHVRYRIVLDEPDDAASRASTFGGGTIAQFAFVHSAHGTSGELVALITDPTNEIHYSHGYTAFLAGTEAKRFDLVCIPAAVVPAGVDGASAEFQDIVRSLR